VSAVPTIDDYQAVPFHSGRLAPTGAAEKGRRWSKANRRRRAKNGGQGSWPMG